MTNQIKSSANVNAHDNFYLYVNKKWLDDPANAIPADYSRWGGFIKLYDDGLFNQIQLIKDIKNKPDKSEEETKLSIIWDASIKRFDRWQHHGHSDNDNDYDPILRELKILDKYFNFDTPIDNTCDEMVTKLAEYFHYSQNNGITNVIDFDCGSDLENANNVVLCLCICGLSLPDRDYYTEPNFQDKRDLFKTHLENIFKIINSKTTYLMNIDNTFVQNVIDFEDKLARMIMKREQQRKYNEYYTNTTLTDIYLKLDELRSLSDKMNNYTDEDKKFKLTDNQKQLIKVFLEKSYELFDFRKILKENLEKSFNDQFDGLQEKYIEHLVAYDGDAIRRVFALILDQNNFHKYKSYLQYKIISSLKEFCTKELNDEFFDFYNRKLNGQQEQKSEDKRSIQLLNAFADEMLGKIYVAKYFPIEYKTKIIVSVNEIINVMRDSIKSNDWLTNITKDKAIEKLDKFTVKIGFPDRWDDYSKFDIINGDDLYAINKKFIAWKLQKDFYSKLNTVLDRNKWLMSPQTVNAYFMPTQNEIVFPAAILQPPFYCKSISDIDFNINEEKDYLNLIFNDANEMIITAVNLGGIGAVIAHEITHGYDDQGRKFDSDGNLNEWWTPDDENLFKLKEAVMTEQANTYRYIDKDTVKEYKLNAQLTMGENLADLGGISITFKALTRYISTLNCTQNTIQALQRIFFKSFANIWKMNVKKDFLIQQLTSDPHSPTDFRTNLVKNIDEFYDVFAITESDQMYIPPNKRVRMW